MSYWNSEKDWPFVPPGYVFMPDVFEVIGRKVLREEWVQEIRTIAPPVERKDCDAWMAVRERREAILEVCHRLAARGVLQFVALDGKEMVPLPSNFWNMEAAKARMFFDSCALKWGASLAVYLGMHPALALFAEHQGGAFPLFAVQASVINAVAGIYIEPLPEGLMPTRSQVIVDDLLRAAAAKDNAAATPIETSSAKVRGKLPASATAADRKNEAFAHAAADLVRTGKKLSEAIRAVAPTNDSSRAQDSVERGIRKCFDIMYDKSGNPYLDQN